MCVCEYTCVCVCVLCIYTCVCMCAAAIMPAFVTKACMHHHLLSPSFTDTQACSQQTIYAYTHTRTHRWHTDLPPPSLTDTQACSQLTTHTYIHMHTHAHTQMANRPPSSLSHRQPSLEPAQQQQHECRRKQSRNWFTPGWILIRSPGFRGPEFGCWWPEEHF